MSEMAKDFKRYNSKMNAELQGRDSASSSLFASVSGQRCAVLADLTCWQFYAKFSA